MMVLTDGTAVNCEAGSLHKRTWSVCLGGLKTTLGLRGGRGNKNSHFVVVTGFCTLGYYKDITRLYNNFKGVFRSPSLWARWLLFECM